MIKLAGRGSAALVGDRPWRAWPLVRAGSVAAVALLVLSRPAEAAERIRPAMPQGPLPDLVKRLGKSHLQFVEGLGQWLNDSPAQLMKHQTVLPDAYGYATTMIRRAQEAGWWLYARLPAPDEQGTFGSIESDDRLALEVRRQAETAAMLILRVAFEGIWPPPGFRRGRAGQNPIHLDLENMRAIQAAAGYVAKSDRPTFARSRLALVTGDLQRWLADSARFHREAEQAYAEMWSSLEQIRTTRLRAVGASSKPRALRTWEAGQKTLGQAVGRIEAVHRAFDDALRDKILRAPVKVEQARRDPELLVVRGRILKLIELRTLNPEGRGVQFSPVTAARAHVSHLVAIQPRSRRR